MLFGKSRVDLLQPVSNSGGDGTQASGHSLVNSQHNTNIPDNMNNNTHLRDNLSEVQDRRHSISCARRSPTTTDINGSCNGSRNSSREAVSKSSKNLRRSGASSGFALIGSEELMKGSRLELRALLASKNMLHAFLRFLQAQHCSENLLFFLVTDAFARVFDEDRADKLGAPINHGLMVEQAKQIHARFLKDNAPKWVCVTPDVLKDIDTCLKKSRVHSSLFVKAQDQSRQTLERDCIPRLVKCILERDHHACPGFEVDRELRLSFIDILSPPDNNIKRHGTLARPGHS